MSFAWNWPGARWWRCDLHLHSPASHDYHEPATSVDDWVGAALGAGLDAIAVTDHDSADWVDGVRGHDAVTSGPLWVLPGVEVTTIENVHLLVLFGPERDGDHVKRFLGSCEIRDVGLPSAKSKKGFLEVMELARQQGGICIAPHADTVPTEGNSSRASLLVGLKDHGDLKEILRSPLLAAAEICTDDAATHRRLRGYDPPELRERLAPGLSLVRFSDAHDLAAIGRRSTWLKATRPDREGVLLALTDGDVSVREAGEPLDLNMPPALAIESIEIAEVREIGRTAANDRSGPLLVEFNPWLNTIVGGRGVGKSSLVQLLRIGLRREQDVPEEGEVAEALRSFVRVPESRRDPGVLTPESLVRVVYRKDGARFRAGWSVSADVPALEQEQGDGTWTAAEGTVRQRLPVRILAQNEIHELARKPRSLLRLIDEGPDVRRGDWDETQETELARFLALRAQARQHAATIEREEEVRGELADVLRRLELFESAEHRAVLEDYQRRQRQSAQLDRWLESLEHVAATVHETARDARLDDAPASAFEAEDEAVVKAATEGATRVQQHLTAAAERAERAVLAARATAEQMRTSPWSARVDAAREGYNALVQELRATGAGDPEQYGGLVQRRQVLEQRLAEAQETRELVASLDGQASESLGRLKGLRRELSDRRLTFLREVLDPTGLVQIELGPQQETEGAEDSLRELLGIERGFDQDAQECVATLERSPGPDGVEQLKERLRAIRAGDPAGDPKDRRFRERLAALAPEVFDRLDAWFPEDGLEPSYRAADGHFRPIGQGSAGQQNAAILAFLLSHGEEPMVIDQPENDLDNTLISDLIVQQLRRSKIRRQLIVVTHNPNIVVNADAEYVIALDMSKGRVHVRQQGGLQEQPVRDEVCKVIEGGREAFELRYSRIGEQGRVRSSG